MKTPESVQSIEVPANTRRSLLQYSRDVLSAKLEGKDIPAPPQELRASPLAELSMGMFVTLRKHGDLRGCIGTMKSDKPLLPTLARVTLESAFQDYRFSPLKSEELPQVVIEHSLLTPPRSVPGPDHIVLGIHGIILKKGFRSAVFLPEVATDQGWTIEQTLAALSRKAGLSQNAWRSREAAFEVFETIHYGESED